MIWLFHLLGKLSLRANHVLGSAIGWATWMLSPRQRKITRANLGVYAAARPADNAADIAWRTVAEQGRGFSELAIAWTAPVEEIYALVRACDGWQHVEAAQSVGHGIIFVTPHLGCYDIAGRYLESRIPVTALYRPPKQRWLQKLMEAGRCRGGGSTAAAGAAGVRTLLKTLKSGGNIIILPDQVPGIGDGVWANFFGKPAYTMTLLPRLARSTDASVLFFFAERLPKGQGYQVHIEPLPKPFSADREIAAREVNGMVESMVSRAPAQYLWGYNRYKHPAGAPLPPPAGKAIS
jgi:KDO2-lipid IV(A) lauroyltransferase